MFGFGKKSKSSKDGKTIELDLVTMESALKDPPQKITLRSSGGKTTKEEMSGDERRETAKEKREIGQLGQEEKEREKQLLFEKNRAEQEERERKRQPTLEKEREHSTSPFLAEREPVPPLPETKTAGKDSKQEYSQAFRTRNKETPSLERFSSGSGIMDRASNNAPKNGDEIERKQKSGSLPHKARQAREALSDYPKIAPKKSAFNKSLLFIAMLIFAITAAAGVYYYFFVVNAPAEEWTPVTIPTPSQEETLPPDPDLVSQTTPETNVLDNASLHSFNESMIADDLKKLAVALKSDPSKDTPLKQGLFIKPVKDNGQKIETSALLSSLKAENEQIQSLVMDDMWLFLIKEEQDAPKDGLPIMKVALVLALDQRSDPKKAIEIITAMEQQLPQQFIGLLIDEKTPPLPQTATFQASAIKNEGTAQTRFFNYESGNPHQSIDWGIVNYLGKQYLAVATSKNSMDKLFEALK